MQRPFFTSWLSVGIEGVRVRDELRVTRVDLVTRDARHAADLEGSFGVRPYRFRRSHETLYAFARLPAASARVWMEDHGLAFEMKESGLSRRDLSTWVQGGS